MTDVSITAEDRERLAKGKFSEWLRELLPGVLDETIDAKLDERIAARQGKPPAQQQQQPQGQPQPQPQQQGRRRSLFDIAMSDTFGF